MKLVMVQNNKGNDLELFTSALLLLLLYMSRWL